MKARDDSRIQAPCEHREAPGEVDEVVSAVTLAGEDNFSSNQFFKCTQLKDCI